MTLPWYLALAGLLLAGGFGWLLARQQAQRELVRLREENARLAQQIEGERRAAAETTRAFETAREQLEASFKALAADVMKASSSEFLKLAETRFQTLQEKAGSEFEKREKAVESLVRPIRETLEKTDQQIRRMETERQKHFGAIEQHLQFMRQAHAELQQETHKLVNALKRPAVRGQWGELTLKRLAELAGMVEHCDFDQQANLEGGDTTQRPDMLVRMPGGRVIVVDAKTPLDAYLAALEARDEAGRDAELQQHARNVRARVRELAGKAYWQNQDASLDFVVLFIPGDQFLAAALERDASLLEDALSQRVVLATPSSLVALLRAIAYGWRQETLAENAEQIRTVGEELYERLCTFAGHLEKLGSSLGRSVEHYNRAVGSFDSRVVPGARRFSEMGIHGKKDLTRAEPVERLPRTPQGEDRKGDEAQTPEPGRE
ncbi:MAG TPA: DNA recombination protein RmuC [Gammaproteobacteria bacterium]|nr:DNA recombination protein RmuC [Gammaproteobacteria bacterium]